MASLVSSLVVFALWATVASAQDKVNVSVYFESYCPDSVKFLTKQLYPAFTMGQLGKTMNITLVPFGKAKIEPGPKYICSHGERECKADRIIACVLNEKDISFENKFKFINCTSSIIASNTTREEYPVKECAAPSNLTEDKINSCVEQEGNALFEKYGNQTKAEVPDLKSVPAVSINNKPDQPAVKDFLKSLCSVIPGNKPEECAKSKNAASGLHAAVLPLVAAVYIATRV